MDKPVVVTMIANKELYGANRVVYELRGTRVERDKKTPPSESIYSMWLGGGVTVGNHRQRRDVTRAETASCYVTRSA